VSISSLGIARTVTKSTNTTAREKRGDKPESSRRGAARVEVAWCKHDPPAGPVLLRRALPGCQLPLGRDAAGPRHPHSVAGPSANGMPAPRLPGRAELCATLSQRIALRALFAQFPAGCPAPDDFVAAVWYRPQRTSRENRAAGARREAGGEDADRTARVTASAEPPCPLMDEPASSVSVPPVLASARARLTPVLTAPTNAVRCWMGGSKDAACKLPACPPARCRAEVLAETLAGRAARWGRDADRSSAPSRGRRARESLMLLCCPGAR